MADTSGANAPMQSASLPSFTFDRGPAAICAVIFAAVALVIAQAVSLHQMAVYLIGGVLGLALYHASFGFTGGWRRMVVERRGRGMRAQLIMVGVAAIAFIPLLAFGSPFGGALAGALAPVGVSVLVGALIFGFGMQLGGGCGSGTLFTAGGGSARMLVTLAFFVLGALLGTAHLPMWLTLPSISPVGLGSVFGPIGGIAVTLVALAFIALLTVIVERRAHGALEQVSAPSRHGMKRFLHGPWPLVGTGLLLALMNVVTLLVTGHPWSITFGFGVWGAKIAQAVGVGVENWAFWTWPAPARALQHSVLADDTSVMNFGILLGAALASALAGKFAPRVRVPLASLVAAAIGGVLMGYGARLAFGCNIGALFSGIASGSLHGWLWFAAAFVGSALGIAVRPVFGLDGFKKK